MSNIVLDTKFVGDIVGTFYLPDYQRGYRWTKDEISLLLNDIYESNGDSYCLQPIVLKKEGDRFELIDGQQRLTTIYLIFKYMESKLGELYAPGFKLEYETRTKSADFLANLDSSMRDDNIDFYFIANAYEFIKEYFESYANGNGQQLAFRLNKLNEYFIESVSVIWYEVDSAEDGIELFERLNIGKIPLTSSELVKALFLRDSARDHMSGRQEEVALQWDMMEQELRNPSFWGFLSNIPGDQFPTRIDLILDLMAGKSKTDREAYKTFFYFDDKIKSRSETSSQNSLPEIWNEVYHLFLTLREWFTDHDSYHKIGYLITTGTEIQEIYNIWRNGDSKYPLSKDQFQAELDRMIRESIAIEDKDDLLALSYETDKAKLQKVLCLFNVETERIMDEGKRRFPFDKHKESFWSLEHIHAQNAEILTKNQDICSWLESHIAILKTGDNKVFEADPELIETMEVLIEQLKGTKDPGHVRERFKAIQEKVFELFTASDSVNEPTYIHSIANMALLDTGQNAALSNSVFDVKRHCIIDYDKEGRYIPICTKHVFFKYYTQENPSLFFWGEADRREYTNAVAEIISRYFSSEPVESAN